MSHFGRIVAIVCVLAGSAQAHFILVAPSAIYNQGTAGDPQKTPPCGADGTQVATNAVTTVAAGSPLTIMINEVIPHAGHFRVALAHDVSSLPADPMTDSACSSNTI